jgi:uncharacterized membrane protein
MKSKLLTKLLILQLFLLLFQLIYPIFNNNVVDQLLEYKDELLGNVFSAIDMILWLFLMINTFVFFSSITLLFFKTNAFSKYLYISSFTTLLILGIFTDYIIASSLVNFFDQILCFLVGFSVVILFSDKVVND